MYSNDLYYLQSEIEYRRERYPRKFPLRRRQRRLQTHSTQPDTTVPTS